MTTEHPITPPPELVQQWVDMPLPTKKILVIASQWGADQELEACCEWFEDRGPHPSMAADVRSARRPKPPSLKEQALASVKRFEENGEFFSDQMRELEFIRKALEQLDD